MTPASASQTPQDNQAGKRVVYTAVMGGYEQFADATIQADDRTDLICFTDDPALTSDRWQIVHIPPRLINDSIRSARFVKIMGPELLAEYDESLWIDNSVALEAPVSDVFDRLLADCDFGLPLHSFRQSVSAEFDAVVDTGFDDVARVYEQLLHYASTEKAVLEQKPFWTAILARKHTPSVRDAMEQWWEHVLRYSRRDQLSINFILNNRDFRINAVDIDNFKSDFHRWPVLQNRLASRGRANSFVEAVASTPSARLGVLERKCEKLQDEVKVLRKRLAREQNWSLLQMARKIRRLFSSRPR
ncbi:MAG: glycosyltransferase domain-containing protein [Paracoccaceae bacterium]